jgi:hypothetical protein
VSKSNALLRAEYRLWKALFQQIPDAVPDDTGLKSRIIDAIEGVVRVMIAETLLEQAQERVSEQG